MYSDINVTLGIRWVCMVGVWVYVGCGLLVGVSPEEKHMCVAKDSLRLKRRSQSEALENVPQRAARGPFQG